MPPTRRVDGLAGSSTRLSWSTTSARAAADKLEMIMVVAEPIGILLLARCHFVVVLRGIYDPSFCGRDVITVLARIRG
jgi:hypothetical protein